MEKNMTKKKHMKKKKSKHIEYIESLVYDLWLVPKAPRRSLCYKCVASCVFLCTWVAPFFVVAILINFLLLNEKVNKRERCNGISKHKW